MTTRATIQYEVQYKPHHGSRWFTADVYSHEDSALEEYGACRNRYPSSRLRRLETVTTVVTMAESTK